MRPGCFVTGFGPPLFFPHKRRGWQFWPGSLLFPPALCCRVVCNKSYIKCNGLHPHVLFFQFSTESTLKSLAKMVGMTNWHSRQDLSVSPAVQAYASLADLDEGHEIWPPTNFWYLVAALLLQRIPQRLGRIQ
jgi:hypothetical protein